MQAALISALALWLAVGPAAAATAYITNEKGNSITVVDLDKLVAVKTVDVGQRPRGIALSQDHNRIPVWSIDQKVTLSIFLVHRPALKVSIA